jgi:hypothetical protein
MHRARSLAFVTPLLVTVLALACTDAPHDDPTLLSGEDESPPTYNPADDTPPPATDAGAPVDAGSVSDSGPVDAGPPANQLYAPGTQLETTSDLNLRSAPDSTTNNVLRVMPLGSVVVVVGNGVPQNTFLKVSHHGLEGWASTKYLKLYVAANANTPERLGYVARAKPGAGFGYWWGHGRYLMTGPTAANKGVCTGDCPNCTYAGNYGSDCSGYLAKIWQVPSSNSDVSVDSHPYSTDDFYNHNNKFAWRDVLRDRTVTGDAMVYRAAGAGHIFLIESGDPWGDMWVYEARGCADGTVHNLRNATDAFKGIGKAAR